MSLSTRLPVGLWFHPVGSVSNQDANDVKGESRAGNANHTKTSCVSETGSLSHDLQAFIHSKRWLLLGISFINSPGSCDTQRGRS